MKIKLICNQQIGDCIRSTTVAKLFKKQYPEYEIEPVMSHPCVYDNNPNVLHRTIEPKVMNANEQKEEKCLRVVCNQDDEDGKLNNPMSIHKLKENDADMIDAMVGYINAKYGFNLKVNHHRADIYLLDEEKEIGKNLGKYWVVNAGCEAKNTRKNYPRKYWEEVFKALPDVKFIQNGLTKDNHTPFPEFKNVINGLDIYDIRQTMGLINNAQGVISPISWNIHAAAAFKKPCIALNGGGEDVCWENYKYDGFNLLHTIGSFDCCKSGGCWRADCTNQMPDGTQKCMDLIKPELIINLIKKYAKK